MPRTEIPCVVRAPFLATVLLSISLLAKSLLFSPSLSASRCCYRDHAHYISLFHPQVCRGPSKQPSSISKMLSRSLRAKISVLATAAITVQYQLKLARIKRPAPFQRQRRNGNHSREDEVIHHSFSHQCPVISAKLDSHTFGRLFRMSRKTFLTRTNR